MSVTALLLCPVCSSSDIYIRRIVNGVIHYKCNNCGSPFTNPIIIPENIANLAKDATSSGGSETVVTESE